MVYHKYGQKIRLTTHFIERWNERIGYTRESKIKSSLAKAARETKFLKRKDGSFGLWVYGSVAVLVLEGWGYWRAVTMLDPSATEVAYFKIRRGGVRK